MNKEIERKLAKLAALEAGGVGEWVGYDSALESWRQEQKPFRAWEAWRNEVVANAPLHLQGGATAEPCNGEPSGGETMNGMNRTVQDLVGTVFMFSDNFSDFHHRERVEFHRTNSPFYAGEKWCVRLRGDCLNQEAEWEWEPSPSNRDDEFYARCRFNTLASAVAAYNKAIARNKEAK